MRRVVRHIFKQIQARVAQCRFFLQDKLEGLHYFSPFITFIKRGAQFKIEKNVMLGFYFILMSVLLACCLSVVMQYGPQNISLNDTVLHFFRGLRTPVTDNIIMSFSLLGDKYILMPLSLALFIWLIWKHQYTAWHVLSVGILAITSVKIIKHLVHLPRPEGLVNANFSSHFSFPSGHTTFALMYYFFLAFLLIQAYKIKRYRLLVYVIAMVPVAASCLARLYFGVHWVTDIIGSILLGGALLMLIFLSYNRKIEGNLAPTGIMTVSLLTLLIAYGVTFYFTFDKLISAYTLVS